MDAYNLPSKPNSIGLIQVEAEARFDQFGPNILPEKHGETLIGLFIKQFRSPFIYVLLSAAALAIFVGQGINALFIFGVLLLNASIGTFQEFSAARALKAMVPLTARVYRDGTLCTLPAEEIVPGDKVVLTSGDKVPADIALSKSKDLFIDESLLTGESVSAEKQASARSENTVSISEQTNAAFAGIIVTKGRAEGEVIATGPLTQLGKIANEVSGDESHRPPLLQRIDRFTRRISIAITFVISVLFTVSILQGQDLQTIFLLAIGLAVSAIPEGLPAALTVALAIGMRRMAKAKVIIRKLVAVESLGSCTLIASDKTGTLTLNEMTLCKIFTRSGQHFDISGEGSNLSGTFTLQPSATPSQNHDELIACLRAGAFANEASITAENGTLTKKMGDQVDLAFLVAAEKYGKTKLTLYTTNEFCNLPYESQTAFCASARESSSEIKVFVKGSLEKILQIRDLSPSQQQSIQHNMERYADAGFRVIALAERKIVDKTMIEQGITESALMHSEFLGLAALRDPLRPEAVKAVADCHAASIEVAMITGDHPATAHTIACELGICERDSHVVTGNELRKIDDPAAFRACIRDSRVFARIEPQQKLAIVEAFIAEGHNVAVTGDGVNDAPALHHAHVGVATGKNGTDVARESANLIITDDNFASILTRQFFSLFMLHI